MKLFSMTRPWFSLDAGLLMYREGRWEKSDLLPSDSQAQIELCLTCPYADDCHDCLTNGTVRRTEILRRARDRKRRKKGCA